MFVECTYECDSYDLQCQQACTSIYHEHFKTCPCKELCPDGCPCPEWECGDDTPVDPDDVHILVFNPMNDQRSATPKHGVVLFSSVHHGDVIEENLEQVMLERPVLFADEPSHMCSFVSWGRMFLAGGIEQYKKKRKFAELKDGALVQLKDLPFDFSRGLCAGDISNDAMLCAGAEHKVRCYKWDGKDSHNWHRVWDTKNHHKGGLGHGVTLV